MCSHSHARDSAQSGSRAMQQGFHSSNGHRQHSSHFLVRLPFHVKEHDDLSLLDGELIDEPQKRSVVGRP